MKFRPSVFSSHWFHELTTIYAYFINRKILFRWNFLILIYYLFYFRWRSRCRHGLVCAREIIIILGIMAKTATLLHETTALFIKLTLLHVLWIYREWKGWSARVFELRWLLFCIPRLTEWSAKLYWPTQTKTGGAHTYTNCVCFTTEVTEYCIQPTLACLCRTWRLRRSASIF
jgi:hypothetical protein